MNLKISKRTGASIVIIMNVLVVVLTFFAGKYLNLLKIDSQDFTIAKVVANKARKGAEKEVIVSTKEITNYDFFIENFTKFQRIKHTYKTKSRALLKKESEQAISIKLTAEDLNVTSILRYSNYINTISTENYKQYKIEEDDLWLIAAPFERPTGGLITKGIFISEAIANKIIVDRDLSTYSDLSGVVLDINTYNNTNHLVDSLYIRGILDDDKGIMAKYRKLYGEEIVLFHNNYYKFDLGLEAHFNFGVSTHKNMYNFQVLKELEIGPLIPLNVAPKTTVDMVLIEAFENYYSKDTLSQTAIVFIKIIYTLFILLVFFVSLHLIRRFKTKMIFFLLNALLTFGVSGMFTLVSSIFVHNFQLQSLNNPNRNMILIIYTTILGIVLYFYESKKEPDNVKQVQK